MPAARSIWLRLDQGHRLLRRAAEVIDSVARREGWCVPFSPVRFLVLLHIRDARAFGISPRRLARILWMKPSSLAHHLDVLEEMDMITRRPRGLGHGRMVSVRPTERGLYALWRVVSVLERRRLSTATGTLVPGPEPEVRAPAPRGATPRREG